MRERWRLVIKRPHVTAEYRMLVAPLVVYFPHSLPFVDFGDESIGDFAAVIRRLGQFWNKLHCCRTELRRIDLVVHEWRSQRDLPPSVACRSCNRPEIAGNHGCCGHITNRGAGIRTCLCALVSAEEKQLVLLDWAADRS